MPRPQKLKTVNGLPEYNRYGPINTPAENYIIMAMSPMGYGEHTGRCMGLCRNTSGNAMLGCRRGLQRSCSEFYVRNTESLKQYENQLEKRLSEVRSQIEKLH